MGKRADRNVPQFEYRADSDPTRQESWKKANLFYPLHRGFFESILVKNETDPITNNHFNYCMQIG